MKKVGLKIKVSHKDPEIERQGAEAVKQLIEAIAKLTGEKVEIKELSHPEDSLKGERE